MNAELVEAYGNLDSSARAYLRRQGVTTETMLCWPGPVGVATVETFAPAAFAFADTGRTVFVHPAYSVGYDSEVIDAVAWAPSNPRRWWTLQGVGEVLGDDHLFEAAMNNLPLVVHPSPLEWLAAGGDGVVVMDAEDLRAVGAVITSDPEFGREVDRALKAPAQPTPTIYVREAA